MLAAHMNATEARLIATSKIPANAGHTLHRGTPREAFITEFLEGHLSANVAIGTGEIIDANSRPRGQRNQFDIVIYKKNYPRLDFGGGISGFLIESVVATIEVKSLLDQAAIDQSIGAARNVKNLNRNTVQSFSSGWIPPKILNFVVAYDGPANMQTVHNWILNSHTKLGIPLPSWIPQNRVETPGSALDGVIQLGTGFVKLNNSPMIIGNNQTGMHVIGDCVENNLLLLFLMLQEACNNVEGAWMDPTPYIRSVHYPNVQAV